LKTDQRRGLPDALWPTPTQQLLLTASLAADEEARRAWDAARPTLDLDHLEPGTFALTPLLYRRLEAWRADDPSLAKLKGLYRHAWARNQLLLGQLKPIVEALRQSDVELLVGGGGMLVAAFYPETGLRPLDRLDLVVHAEDAERSAAALRSLGWNAAETEDVARLGRRPAAWFVRPDGPVAVLRTRVFPAEISPWEDTIVFELDDVECRGLSAARQLLWTCLGEDRHQIWGRVQWLPDLRALIESGHELDWERVLSDAAALRAELPLRDALVYARDIHIPIPENVVGRLDAAPVRIRERIAHSVSRSSGSGLGGKLARRVSRQPLRP
jgi:hypothetical protein